MTIHGPPKKDRKRTFFPTHFSHLGFTDVFGQNSCPKRQRGHPTDVFTFKFRVSLQTQRKPVSTQGGRNRQETTDKELPALPCKNTPATAGKQNTPLCRFRTPAEGRVCSPHKNCVTQNGYNGKPTEGRVWSPQNMHLKTGTTGSQQKDVFGLQTTCTSKRVRDTART